MHTIVLGVWAYNFTQWGQIRKIEIFMEMAGHAGHNYEVCAHACNNAYMLYSMGPYFRHIEADKRD